MAGTKEHVCGECTMCCKLLGVEEIGKAPNQWCGHCAIGSGCQIYATRPKSCQEFECLWLQTPDMPEELRPDRSKVVLWMTTDNKRLIAGVDPARPDAYKEGMMGRTLDVLIEKGLDVIVVNGDKRKAISGSTKGMQELVQVLDVERKVIANKA